MRGPFVTSAAPRCALALALFVATSAAGSVRRPLTETFVDRATEVHFFREEDQTQAIAKYSMVVPSSSTP